MKLVINKYIVQQIFCFIFIRFLYVNVTIKVLDGLSYTGSIGGYRISYDFRRDMVAFLFFAIIIMFYSMRPMWDDFKSVLLHFIMILYYIPINVEYVIHENPVSFLAFTSLYIIIMIYILTRKKGMRDNVIKGEEWLYDNRILIFCVAVCCIFIVYKLLYNGLSLRITIDSDYVYTNRAAYSESTSKFSGTLIGYTMTLLSCLQSTMSVVLLFIGLRRKKILYVIIAILDNLSEFSLYSMKGTLFTPVLVVAVYFVYKKKWLKDYRKFFNMCFLLLMIICYIESKFFRVGKIYFIIIRRVMFSPAWLNSMYYDYFSSNSKVLLTDSVIGLQRLFPHVYDTSPLMKISETYFCGTADSPNTGMFAAAYMQLGVLGIILQPVLIYFMSKWASRVLQGYGFGFVVAIASIIVQKMLNVPILRTDFVLSFFVCVFLLEWLRRICLGELGLGKIKKLKLKLKMIN